MKLPDFPWDLLAPYKKIAQESAGDAGLVDLSIGTPVDDSPAAMQSALVDNANAPGYPLTIGSAQLRTALERWVREKFFPRGAFDFLPTIGSKELVGLLPTLMQARKVLIPELAYPTYQVGAIVAGAECIAVSDDCDSWPVDADLVWINSPANPHGRVLSAKTLRKIITWARHTQTVVVSDECYFELGWESTPVSLLEVADDDARGLLIVHSLSKCFNAAGYRAAFIAGDPELIGRLREVRKHLGLIMPGPIQSAMASALSDSSEIAVQKERYRARRTLLRKAIESAGFEVSYSEAGLYLWATKHEECWQSVGWAAERGVLVTPGIFYGEKGSRHVRIALTASDADIDKAIARLR